MQIHTHNEMHLELDAILANAMHVRIQPERLQAVAQLLSQQLINGQDHQGDPASHPDETLPENDADTLQFFLMAASQHFCIWRRNEQTDHLEAWDTQIDGKVFTGGRGIMASLVRALREGVNLLDPGYLRAMDLEGIHHLYRDERRTAPSLQLLGQRLAKFNEIGRVLDHMYDGHASALFKKAEGHLYREDGDGLVQRLIVDFPVSYYDWPFCKLAVLVAKWARARNALTIPTTSEYRDLTGFNPSEFEVAADYYIPLYLMRSGVLAISDELARRLRQGHMIARNSRMELEFRAATMVAGRELARLADQPIDAIDEALWEHGFMHCRSFFAVGDRRDGEISEHHRLLASEEDVELMDLRWPLVWTPWY